ncbi:hypothetical protein AAX19_09365 [Oenococcus oeni]|nr:hypothetical protein AAX19_09365 [Oenococcus oeni]
MKIPIKYTGSASIPGTKNKYVAYIYENDEKNEIVLQLLCNSKALRENKDELPKLIGRISKLEVKLANGESLLLLSCNFFNHTSRISYGDEIFKYYVDYIIENLNLKQKDKFCDAEYNVTGILKWGSAYKFRISDVSNHYIDLVEDQKILIFKNEEYKIEYQVSSNYPIFFDEEDIELKQIPQFIIKSTKGKHSIYWFESIFNQMKIILELSTHQKINYQKMQLLKVDEEKYDPEKDILYGVHSKFSNANQNSDIRASTCLFNCRQLIESADLEAWNDKSKKTRTYN